jgi:hypothetical protein
MTANEPAPASEQSQPRVVRLPGFTAGQAVGLGDAIKKATSLAGIRPCGSCLERAARLNRWLVLSGKRSDFLPDGRKAARDL